TGWVGVDRDGTSLLAKSSSAVPLRAAGRGVRLHVTRGSLATGCHPRPPRHLMSPPRKRGPIVRAEPGSCGEGRRRAIVRAESRRCGGIRRISGRGQPIGLTTSRLFLASAIGPRFRGGDTGWVGGDMGPRFWGGHAGGEVSGGSNRGA